MRIQGYCSSCRRIRPVRVTGSNLATAMAMKQVPMGQCSSCQEAEEQARRDRAGRR